MERAGVAGSAGMVGLSLFLEFCLSASATDILGCRANPTAGVSICLSTFEAWRRKK